MSEKLEKHPLRIVLRAGASVFGLSALILLIFPEIFLGLLSLAAGAEQVWSMRMIAVTMVALMGNMLIVSIYADLRGVRLASRVMQFSAFGLGALTLAIPAELSWFTYLYAAVGFVFAGAYTVFLFRR